MLVSQTNPVGPFSFVKIFFCSMNFHSCCPRDLKGSVGHLRSLRLGQLCWITLRDCFEGRLFIHLSAQPGDVKAHL